MVTDACRKTDEIKIRNTSGKWRTVCTGPGNYGSCTNYNNCGNGEFPDMDIYFDEYLIERVVTTSEDGHTSSCDRYPPLPYTVHCDSLPDYIITAGPCNSYCGYYDDKPCNRIRYYAYKRWECP